MKLLDDKKPADLNEDDEEVSSEEESMTSEDEELEDQEESILSVRDCAKHENFIDDSEPYVFDLENLGDSLQDQLMKVSIRMHEHVYGKERAHNEKLFLNNWYGAGELFFKNCSMEVDNPPSMQFVIKPKEAVVDFNEGTSNDQENQDENQEVGIEEDDISVEGEFHMTEEENLTTACQEDLEYFGYALFDDDFDEFPIFDEQEDDSDETLEQSSEEESLKYQLRRMLREQSYECITNFFSN